MNLGKETQVEKREFNNDIYVGVASCTVMAINPTKEEIAKIYGTTPDKVKDPVYLKEDVEVTTANGENKQGKEVTISVFLKTVQNYNSKPIIKSLNFKIKEGAFISQSGKHQVIDEYGNSSWVTAEQFKNKEVPTYTSKDGETVKFDIYPKYRHAYKGETNLIEFIKNWLGLPQAYTKIWDNNQKKFTSTDWKSGEELEAAACSISIEEWKEIFKGNYNMLRSLVKGREAFQVKIVFGLSEKDGKQYQTISRNTLRNDANYNAIKRLEKDLISANITDRYWTELTVNGVKEKHIPQDLVKVTPSPDVENINEGSSPFAETSIPEKEKEDDMPF